MEMSDGCKPMFLYFVVTLLCVLLRIFALLWALTIPLLLGISLQRILRLTSGVPSTTTETELAKAIRSSSTTTANPSPASLQVRLVLSRPDYAAWEGKQSQNPHLYEVRRSDWSEFQKRLTSGKEGWGKEHWERRTVYVVSIASSLLRVVRWN
jgi:hypothetical protein